jgi:hypothetical protein
VPERRRERGEREDRGHAGQPHAAEGAGHRDQPRLGAGRPAPRSSRSNTDGRGTSTASRVRSHTAAKSITLSSITLAAAVTRARHGSQDSRCCSAEAPSASESVRST